MDGLETASQLAREAVLTAVVLSVPMLGAALAVGLVFAVLQAVSQVHEQTISFVPKLLAVGAVVFVLSPWILSALTAYTREVLGLLGPG